MDGTLTQLIIELNAQANDIRKLVTRVQELEAELQALKGETGPPRDDQEVAT